MKLRRDNQGEKRSHVHGDCVQQCIMSTKSSRVSGNGGNFLIDSVQSVR